jgi:phage shock protein A
MADNPQDNLSFQEQLNRAIQEQLQLSRLNNDEIREILDRTELTADARRKILQLTRDTNRELSKNASLVEGLNEEFRETKDIDKDINKATQLRNSLIAEAGQARANGNRELSSALANQARTVQNTIGNLEQERNIAQEIDNSFGAMGKSLGFINKLTGGKIKRFR